MKKVLLSLVALLLLASTGMYGQEDAGKAYKKAKTLLGNFNVDPSNNEGKLQEAKQLIDVAAASGELKSDAKFWITRGEIYNTLASQDINKLLINPEYKLPEGTEKNASEAVEAYKMAISAAEKKYETRDAQTGLSESARLLNAVGNQHLQLQEYAEAYSALQKVLDVHNLMAKEGAEPVFENPEDVDQHTFVTAFCARQANQTEAAKSLFKTLYDKDYAEPQVYANYFSMLSVEEGQEDAALAVMEKGKKLFPGNTELLFAEINYYLREERLDDLVGKLKQAIEKEPENVSLYSTLGNVYDNLFQRELEAGNEAKAQENFDEALKYYNQALEKKPDFVDATYSIGALYYNKAAAVTKEMMELEADLSKEGIKKYNDKKKEVFDLFDKALPYFKKAESNNPNDINTLIALREIYARKDDLAMSNEFKKRLENVQNNVDNGKPYFNE